MIMRYQKEINHLKGADPALAQLIERCGPCTLSPDAADPFAALCESILYQQLSGKAAATIASRFKALYGDAYPHPAQLLKTKDEVLRGGGISRGKLLALQDLARKAQDGAVDFKAILKMDDDAVIHHLIQVRGIGRWTAEMFLIFNQGRLDVFPVLDLGIQKGVQKLYGYKKLPAESTMRKHAEKWKPYRTIATWYLWRQVDG